MFQVFSSNFQKAYCMICVEVTETGVSLSKVASDMPRLAKLTLKRTVDFVKNRA